MAGAVDDAHAAVADLVDQLVARRAGGDDACGHAWLGFGGGVGRRILGHGSSSSPAPPNGGPGPVQRRDTHEGSRLRRWRGHPAASPRTTPTGGLHALLPAPPPPPILPPRRPARHEPLPLRPRPPGPRAPPPQLA